MQPISIKEKWAVFLLYRKLNAGSGADAEKGFGYELRFVENRQTLLFCIIQNFTLVKTL